MKRKESYFIFIKDIIKFSKATKENNKPDKANIISLSRVLTVLSGLFLVYCIYNIIERAKDKNIYPKIE